MNYPGTYASVCVELEIDTLAVNTLLQSNQVHDVDGTSSYVAFNNMPQASLQVITFQKNIFRARN